MASITIRNLDDDVKTRLRKRAAGHGRSMEAEARLIERPSRELFVTAVTEAEVRTGIAFLPEGRRRRDLREVAEQAFGNLFAGRILPFDSEAARAPMRKSRRAASPPGGRSRRPTVRSRRLPARAAWAIATRNIGDFEKMGIVVSLLLLFVPFVVKANDSELPSDVNPRDVIRADLCSKYTVTEGEIPSTRLLYLGEGADQYRELIELAVKKWNAAVYAAGGPEQLIKITDEAPHRYYLEDDFYEYIDYYIYLQVLNDYQSAIYFKVGGGVSGFAAGSDIYINPHLEEKYGGPGKAIVVINKLMDLGEGRGLYTATRRVYGVILHEIGHLVGLRHIPNLGNIMGPELDAQVVEQWRPFAELARRSPGLDLEDVGIVADSKRFYSTDIIDDPEELEMVDRFTRTMELGEQEKMLLNCIYQQGRY